MIKRSVLIAAMVIIATGSHTLFAEVTDKEEIRRKLIEVYYAPRVSVKNVNSHSVTLGCACNSISSYSSEFRIRIMGNFRVDYTPYLPIDIRSYTVANLEANTTYSFTIEAKDNFRNRFYSSNTVKLTTKHEPLKLPRDQGLPNLRDDWILKTNLTASNITDTSIILVWTCLHEENIRKGFMIKSKTLNTASSDRPSDYMEIAVLPSDHRTYTLADLQPDTTYQFRIEAEDVWGTVHFSNDLTVKTKKRAAVNH